MTVLFLCYIEEFKNFQCYLNGKISQVCSSESKTEKNNQFWANALVLGRKNMYFFKGGKLQLCGSKLRLKFPFENLRYGSEREYQS
jgi:hypothetical protein